MRKTVFAIIALSAVVHFFAWFHLNRPVEEIAWSGPLRGVSFSPYRPGQSPYDETYPTAEEIDQDLALIAGEASTIRTYSSTNGFEAIPRLAMVHGLNVMAGAWLDKRADNNALEIENLIRNADMYPNVRRVIVGNETLLRGEHTVEELARYLDYVRARITQPVSTAEPWHVWIRNPQLAEHVDFIAIHVLPYWEKVPNDQALAWVLERYKQVKAAFPGKHVVLSEVGWPSGGGRRGEAKPSALNAARFLRQFLNAARREGLDYFIVEAFDQGWKRAEEGPAGPHWGLYNSNRNAKYDWNGSLVPDEAWALKASGSIALATLPLLLLARRRPDIKRRGYAFFAGLLQVIAALLVWWALLPWAQALTSTDLLLWLLLVPAQALLIAVVLINAFEMLELLWQSRLRRQFLPARGTPLESVPMVSLHLAIHNEPPELVIETLDSLARLDYPDYEVLVLDNNTMDPAVWKPVEAHCRRLGARFRFFHLEDWPGYKAGALNYGLAQTDPRAAVIGVVDSDYVVEPDWLSSCIPHFARSEVGFVQAPQDHRGWRGNAFKTMCNWEYTGFFQIGMVQRNERNAIIQHGTMTLIRRQALEQTGGWGEWCICEDAELGLRLFERGWEGVYINHVFGRGLTPDTFAAYKNQRFRWVYGAVQIIKRHWRELVFGHGTRLTAGQRLHFLAGWLPWLADAMHLVFSTAAIYWTIGMVLAPRWFQFPIEAFLLPTLGAFGFKLLHSLTLYRARVHCGWRERLGAAVAGMSLTHTIAKAVFDGLVTRGRPFLRTPKTESTLAVVNGFRMAREETLYCLLLWGAVGALVQAYGLADDRVQLWSAVLLAQSVPYAAAFAMAWTNAMPAVRLARAARRAPETVPASLPAPSPLAETAG